MFEYFFNRVLYSFSKFQINDFLNISHFLFLIFLDSDIIKILTHYIYRFLGFETSVSFLEPLGLLLF